MRFLIASLLGFSLFAYAENVETKASKPKSGIEGQLKDPEFKRDYVRGDEYIRAILEEHEDAFPGAFKHPNLYYYTRLDRISRVQQGLLYELSENPNFMREYENREPLTEFKVTVVKAMGNQAESAPTLPAWEAFKKKFAALISDDMSAQSFVDFLKARFLDEADKLGSWAYIEEKTPMRMSLARYILASSLILDGSSDLTATVLREKILSLDVGVLDYLQDEQSYEPHLKPFKENMERFTRKQLGNLSDIDFNLQRAYEILSDEIYGNVKFEANLREGDFITIREVHPNCSIFRGYVGNDCSTSFSPGFVLNPFDRYYYAFGSKGQSLGYVGLSIVSVGEKKALFVHTIQGPDFTTEQVEMVLRGFQDIAKSTYQADSVVLAIDDRIYENVNFRQIRAIMSKSVESAPRVSVDWQDMEYREIIKHWDSTMTYDDPDKNQEGRKLSFEPGVVRTEVEHTPFKANFKKPIQSLEDVQCQRILEKKSNWW